FTRLIDDLATAWPKVGKRRFSMTEWIRDAYTGRKQVIVQSGPDPTLTKAYIAAMINVAVPDLIGPGLPDNEGGRGLYFVFDELTSAGRLN
ncbi:type IV secretion system DNA-binding domain-containing protein, partial [Enterococcus faecium]|uniref:type IV secretion system DNA-binding domain-containing protein n=1 Tax=Enterococcus faecium TaxID=1352 RepID=UPI003DA1A0E7